MAMKILLIEDDLQICKVITKYFTNNGAEITEVHNGTDALDTVEKGLDGYSASGCRRIYSMPQYKAPQRHTGHIHNSKSPRGGYPSRL